jgi:hypothetical protein
MDGKAVLDFMKSRVCNEEYELLSFWVNDQKPFLLFFKPNFEIKKTTFGTGYVIQDRNTLNFKIIY